MRFSVSLVTAVFLGTALLSNLVTAEETKPQVKNVLKAAVFDGCPFSCPDGTGRFPLILSWAFETTPYELEFVHLNFERAKKDLARGKIDLLPGILKDGIDPAYFPNDPLFFTQMCFVTQEPDNWSYAGPSSLKGRQLVLEQGILYAEGFLGQIDQFGNAQFLHGNNIAWRQLKMLDQGRGDTTIIERTILQQELRKTHYRKKSVRLAGCFPEDHEFVAVSTHRPDSKAIRDLLSIRLREVHQSARFKNLISVGNM